METFISDVIGIVVGVALIHILFLIFIKNK